MKELFKRFFDHDISRRDFSKKLLAIDCFIVFAAQFHLDVS